VSEAEGLGTERDARLAAELLNNPLLKEVLAELDTDAVRAWRASSNVEQREYQWHQMMAIQSLVHRIEGRLSAKRIADGRAQRRQAHG
jgi:hypothetical protein